MATLAPPVSVVVTSAAGGTRTLPVKITGGGHSPLPVVAQAGPDQAVQPGQTVTLDGSASSGSISAFAWSSPAGTTLSTPDAAQTSFVAPTTAGDDTFSLTVNGPGGPSTATVVVTVLPQAPGVTANAGPAQTVQRATVVTLDGSQSVGAASYLWTQVKITPGDPTVTLTAPTTAHPSFTFPKYAAPATNGRLRLQLQVTDVAGASSSPERRGRRTRGSRRLTTVVGHVVPARSADRGHHVGPGPGGGPDCLGSAARGSRGAV